MGCHANGCLATTQSRESGGELERGGTKCLLRNLSYVAALAVMCGVYAALLVRGDH